MDEQELVNKYRLMYAEDQKAYKACVVKHGERPKLTGEETPEQREAIRETQAFWDSRFETDT